ncbi:hypothetical protein LTR36_010213 [Oleoguttula mirabilis]|uniref:Uncharacterized protein n=1 Tax=Oleoguttula mirabilis TaxID=1507867 RepID=A0AAV9JRW0_9PEZI|nr:hypothetical protein LTR36_010213 [Oleoguttula mirabilis]
MVVSRHISINPQTIRTLHARQHFSSPSSALTGTNPSENDQHQLLQARRTIPCVQQIIAFTELSAELRNRIYGYAFANGGREDALLVVSPFIDDAMTLARQPAITKLSQQIRAESLAMFYDSNKFVAYIRAYDFRELCQWVKCVTSAPNPSTVRVHVKLMDWVLCEYQLLPLMRAWRDMKHETVHLEIHNCIERTLSHPFQHVSFQPFRWETPTFDQRELLTEAIVEAEALKARGYFTELSLREACALLVQRVAKYLSRCDAVSAAGTRCQKHGVAAE